MKNKHYKTLDVKENATPQEIKKAYKKKASKAHPDHGGNASDMAEINNAYAVLSNPERKKKYDETGNDQNEMPIYDIVTQLILKEFSDYLNNQKEENLIAFAKDSINKKINMAKIGIEKGKSAKKYFLNKIDKIKVKEGAVNLAKMIIENNLAQIEREIEHVTEQINILNLALIELDNYTS